MHHSVLWIEETEGVALVHLDGKSRLDHRSESAFQDELERLVAAGGRGVVLDLARVPFLSTQMIGTLVTLRRVADQAGVEMVLGEPRPELDRVLRIQRLDKLFTVVPTLAAGVQHFATGQDGNSAA